MTAKREAHALGAFREQTFKVEGSPNGTSVFAAKIAVKKTEKVSAAGAIFQIRARKARGSSTTTPTPAVAAIKGNRASGEKRSQAATTRAIAPASIV